ncbi:glycosyltransferase [Paucibacter sp. APW11]|uniref:Glycosyltransferase n=1 Tax=Roseateles aquae TaxID=3077235 RepID=A0ABU3PIK3_9BURK|nr:nucleotide disphospho-sugar-binding domain-containing protein [Paucibacter sp. APW11]MDT9002372.1 glycosyltransferase [Paucibacter sp. APW11]
MTETPHYLILTVGTTGDLHPMLSLAQALQAMGRPVTVLSHSIHGPRVAQLGLPFVGLGREEDYEALLRNPDIWDARKSFAALMGSGYREGLTELAAFFRGLPARRRHIVISHPFLVPGAAMARAAGQVERVVAAYLAPSNLKSCADPLTIGPVAVPSWVPMSWRRAYWRFVERGWIDPVALAQINPLRAAQGLAPVNSFLGHIAEAPDLSLLLFPAWFAADAPDWPQPRIGGDFQLFEASAAKPLEPALSRFLATGPKPLLFTAGTGNRHAKAFFAHALAACAALGRRALLLSQDRQQLPAQLPDWACWQPYVPLAQLLGQVDAIVHHGGIGTSAEALRQGTPQLITPFAWDQFDNGARLARLGVARVLPATRLNPRRLASRLRDLLEDPAVPQHCARAAAHFAQCQAPQLLCERMEAQLAAMGSAGQGFKRTPTP